MVFAPVFIPAGLRPVHNKAQGLRPLQKILPRSQLNNNQLMFIRAGLRPVYNKAQDLRSIKKILLRSQLNNNQLMLILTIWFSHRSLFAPVCDKCTTKYKLFDRSKKYYQGVS